MKQSHDVFYNQFDAIHNKRLKGFILFLLLLTAFRLWLAVYQNLNVLTTAEVDDHLMIRYMDTLRSGYWLGSYSNRTLIKGISFPLFLCLLKILHLPYGVGVGFLIVTTGVLFTVAIRPKVANPYVCGIIYLFVVFNPVGFSTVATMRVYRNAISPWVATIVMSGVIALFVRREQSPRQQLPWAILLGIALPFFCYLREDAIWIMAFVGIAFICIFVDVLRQEMDKRGLRIGILALPLICLLAGHLVYGAINQAYYGVFIINDRTSGPCAEVMRLLYQIDDGVNADKEWVSDKDLVLAKKASPHLRSLKSWKSWRGWKDWQRDKNGGIKGDIAEWALRDVVATNGYYKDAQSTNVFYEKVAAELRVAFKEGRLKKQQHVVSLTTQCRPLSMQDITASLGRSFIALHNMGVYFDCEMAPVQVIPHDSGHLREWEAALGQLLPDTDKAAAGDLAEQAITGKYASTRYASNTITHVYQAVAPILFYGALAGYIYLWIALLLKRRPRRPGALLITTGLLLSALVNVWVVTLFSAWMSTDSTFSGIYYYGNAAYIILAMFEVVVWCAVGKDVQQIIKTQKICQ